MHVNILADDFSVIQHRHTEKDRDSSPDYADQGVNAEDLHRTFQVPGRIIFCYPTSLANFNFNSSSGVVDEVDY